MKKNSKGAADASPCKKERLMILDIKEEALAAASRWQDLFYNLHRCPELGRKEQRTADMIRRRLEELSILNVLFCMLVVLIHVLSHAVGALDRTGWQYALVLIPQRLAFVSVPGFFYLSGVKLTLPRERPLPLRDYYLGRIKNIYLPYLLAAAVYYLFFVTIGWYTFSPAQFLRETALGTLSAQFYFLVALMQFILLAPLFRRLARRYAPVVLLPLALGITWLSSIYFNAVLQLAVPDAAFPYGDASLPATWSTTWPAAARDSTTPASWPCWRNTAPSSPPPPCFSGGRTG